MFKLHAQLKKDGHLLGRFALCHLLLMNDARYPWFILVPARADISEIFQLSSQDQQQLWHESSQLAEALMQAFDGDKMNIAALGNVVPQLHVHHIVRHTTDAAWPAPIWGKLPARPYTDSARESLLEKLFSLPLLQSDFTRQV